MTGDPSRQAAFLAPYSIRRDFLPPLFVRDLLAYSAANEYRFLPSRVGDKTIDTTKRVSLLLRDLGPFDAELKARLTPLIANLVKELKVSLFTPTRLEVEMVAHNDGAFLARHVDTQFHDDTPTPQDYRILSGVYYFHAMPKAFAGGMLRLHEVLPGDGNFIDIEPVHNSLVVFPSWAPHEVIPVTCPSRSFSDSRFAINCWFRGV